MKATELAVLLHGREYPPRFTPNEIALAKANSLVIVYGASDDLVELEGAIHEELGANDGTTLNVTPTGLLIDWENLDKTDEAEVERYFDQKRGGSREIQAVWCPVGTDISWGFITSIPHATFDVMEDGAVFCRAIVFCLNDVLPPLFVGEPA